MEKTVIEVRNIVKKYKTYETNPRTNLLALFRRKYFWKMALDNVSFDISEGSIVALLGKNGSGKSTIVKIMTGILYSDKGTAKVLDLNPWEDRIKLAMQIGVVLGAHGQLYTDLPASDTFELMRHIYHIPERDYQKRLSYLIDVLDLEKVYKRQVRQLSLGESMKCNFVSSVLHAPRIVFLDEPTIGVDLPSKTALREAILELQRKYKTTFLLTTHIVEDITIADKILMLDKGKIIFNDTKEKLEQLYGDNRQVELHLQRGRVESYAKFGKIMNSNKNKIRLEVEKETLKNRKFIDMLASDDVLDYKVTEPGLAYVLSRLYGSLEKRRRVRKHV